MTSAPALASSMPARTPGSTIGAVPAFDSITVEGLRSSGSMKWRKYPETIAAFVAEMDFGVAAPVAAAVEDLMHRGLLGYMPRWMEEELQVATAGFYERSYDWDIDPAHVFPTADVIRSYEFAIDLFTPPGGKIVLLTPAYGPFFQVAQLLRREVVEVPMLEHGDAWVVDLDALDAAFADGGALLVLCNPHNPLGKVYTHDEMVDIAEVVDRHGARVFADEIHSPLIFPGSVHVPYAAVSEASAEHTLSATSASKAFNLPGLKCAQLITSNARDKARLDELGMVITHGTSNPGAVANTAAYTHGGPWLDSVRDYLAGNREVLVEAVAEHLPGARMRRPDATYFGWIDVRELGLGDGAHEHFLTRAGVALSDGHAFGRAGHGHVRFNFAMPRDVIPRAVRAMADSLQP